MFFFIYLYCMYIAIQSTNAMNLTLYKKNVLLLLYYKKNIPTKVLPKGVVLLSTTIICINTVFSYESMYPK